MTQAVLYGARIGGGGILTGNITNLLLLDIVNTWVLFSQCLSPVLFFPLLSLPIALSV